MTTSSIEPLHLALRSPAFKILVVDDTPLNRLVTSSQLKALGFQAVDCVENGRIALEYLQQHDYDLVLMDCRMPELNGYETTEIIRRQETKGQHQVVVAMTANVFDDERRRCMAVGMDDYIAKPITLDTLQALLERCSKHYFEGDNATINISEPAVNADFPIDFKRLDKLLGEDPLLHRLVLQELPKSLPNYMTNLEAAIATGNMAIVSDEAHRLKGSLVMAGVKELPELCNDLELSANQANLRQVRLLTATLKTRLGMLFKFIRDHYREQN